MNFILKTATVLVVASSALDLSAASKLSTPGFAIQFEKGDSSFYALVCYSCSDILFFDAKGGRVGGWGMTYEAAFALIHRFYELFPDDPEVQGLKF